MLCLCTTYFCFVSIDLLLIEILNIYILYTRPTVYIYINTVQIRNLKIVLLTSNNIRKCYVCVLHICFCFNRPIIDHIRNELYSLVF